MTDFVCNAIGFDTHTHTFRPHTILDSDAIREASRDLHKAILDIGETQCPRTLVCTYEALQNAKKEFCQKIAGQMNNCGTFMALNLAQAVTKSPSFALKTDTLSCVATWQNTLTLTLEDNTNRLSFLFGDKIGKLFQTCSVLGYRGREAGLMALPLALGSFFAKHRCDYERKGYHRKKPWHPSLAFKPA